MKAIVYAIDGSPDVLSSRGSTRRRSGTTVHPASIHSWDWSNLTGDWQAHTIRGFLKPKRKILGAPVIDRTFPLRDTAEAFRYYGGGNALGKAVVTV